MNIRLLPAMLLLDDDQADYSAAGGPAEAFAFVLYVRPVVDVVFVIF